MKARLMRLLGWLMLMLIGTAGLLLWRALS